MLPLLPTKPKVFSIKHLVIFQHLLKHYKVYLTQEWLLSFATSYTYFKYICNYNVFRYLCFTYHMLGGFFEHWCLCIISSTRLYACFRVILNSCKIIEMGQIYFLIIILKSLKIQLKKGKETVAFPQTPHDLRLCHSFWFLFIYYY